MYLKQSIPETIIPCTPEISTVCDLTDRLIEEFLTEASKFDLPTYYEFATEAWLLMGLIIRNVEGVLVLARNDLVLLPSALNLTRSAFEIAIRTLWILNPSDPFEREVRWLAQLQTEEKFLLKETKRLDEFGIEYEVFAQRLEAIASFRKGVTDLLPTPYKALASIPDIASMLLDIGMKDLYSKYSYLSQFTHGTHFASGLYRKNLGDSKELGEFISASSWKVIFEICSLFLIYSGERMLQILSEQDNINFPSKELALEISYSIKVL